jgi:dTDP-4-amino-4,6-dideoxygalactose transaminase
VPADAGERHVYHRFVVAVDRPLEPVLAHLERRGIAARRPVFRPIHQALGLVGYPTAERLWRECLSLPCYPLLTDDEADTVARVLAEALA